MGVVEENIQSQLLASMYVHTHTQIHMQKHSIIWGKYAEISNLI